MAFYSHRAGTTEGKGHTGNLSSILLLAKKEAPHRETPLRRLTRRSGERSALAERTFGILGKIVCRLRMFLQEGRRRDKAVCCGDITSRRDIVQIGNAQQGLNVHVMRLGQHGVPEEDQAFRDTGPHLLIPPERTGFQALHGGRRALVAKQLA